MTRYLPTLALVVGLAASGTASAETTLTLSAQSSLQPGQQRQSSATVSLSNTTKNGTSSSVSVTTSSHNGTSVQGTLTIPFR